MLHQQNELKIPECNVFYSVIMCMVKTVSYPRYAFCHNKVITYISKSPSVKALLGQQRINQHNPPYDIKWVYFKFILMLSEYSAKKCIIHYIDESLIVLCNICFSTSYSMQKINSVFKNTISGLEKMFLFKSTY